MAMKPLEYLTTTAPDEGHKVAAALLSAALIAVVVFGLPFATAAMPVNPSFLPGFGATAFFVDLTTALMLLSQGKVAREPDARRLGVAYLFSATIIIPHMAAFPGVLAEAPLIGTTASAVWLWTFWHGGFALLVAWYAIRHGRPGYQLDILPTVALVVGAVAVLAAIASIGLPYLPTLLVDNRFDRLNTLGIGPTVLACNLVALILVLVRLRLRTTMALWLTVAMLAANLDVTMTLSSLARFSLGWYVGRCASMLTGIVIMTGLLVEFIRLYGRVGAINRELERAATTDGLTGVANRRAFDRTIEHEWRRAQRDNKEIALIMLDVDWFKLFNDHYGHMEGDECLRRVAAVLDGALRRPADLPARYGGEEFVAILPSTNTEGARIIAERIRVAISDAGMAHEKSVWGHVTVSVGVASLYPGAENTAADLLLRADAALYRAKNVGRNRVVCAEEEILDDAHSLPERSAG